VRKLVGLVVVVDDKEDDNLAEKFNACVFKCRMEDRRAEPLQRTFERARMHVLEVLSIMFGTWREDIYVLYTIYIE
jgi:hypothetical protein